MESENLTADGNSFLLKSISENILRVLVLSASLWILGFGALVWVGTVAGVDWFSQGAASAVDQRRLLSAWGLSSSLILVFCLLVVVIWRLSLQRGLRKKISQALGVAQSHAMREVTFEVAQRVAHDLRSPLSHIKGVVKDLDGSQEEQGKLLSQAIQKVDGVLEKLLRKDARNPKVETYELNPVLDSIVEKKREEYSHMPNIRFTGRFTPVRSIVTVDRSDLERVISNLINNSVESIGDKDGYVRVVSVPSGATTQIIIEDNGGGMSAETLERARSEKANWSDDGESGGGLPYAYKTLESWGGTMDLSSTPGDGTTAILTVPRL